MIPLDMTILHILIGLMGFLVMGIVFLIIVIIDLLNNGDGIWVN